MRIAAKSIRDFEAAVERGAKAHYKVVDSGAAPLPSVYRWAGWLDNRRLLFKADMRPLESIDPKGSLVSDHGVLLWDTEAQTLETIVRVAAVREVCVDGNHVVIDTNPDRWTRVVYEGTFPDLKSRVPREREAVLSFNQTDCRPPHPETRGPTMLPDTWLREGHGFIERPWERLGGSEPHAIFHRADGTEVVLPLPATGAWLLAYAPWRNAYLLQGETRAPGAASFRRNGERQRGDEAVLFWLHPDGRTAPVVVPYGEWDKKNNASRSYRPTRLGVVLHGGDSQNETDPGFAGLYLFESATRVVRLVSGPAWIGAVSSDGCRVAFAHAPDRKSRQTMKMIDLCRMN